MKTLLRPLAALVLLVASGCATAALTSGKRFDASKVSQIKDATTTRAEILEWFGEPLSKYGNAPDSETWLYFFSRSKSEVQSYLVTVAVKTEGTTKKLEIFLKNGVVESHTFVDGPVVPAKS